MKRIRFTFLFGAEFFVCSCLCCLLGNPSALHPQWTPHGLDYKQMLGLFVWKSREGLNGVLSLLLTSTNNYT